MRTGSNHRVFIGLGTNLGDRLANLQAAIQSLLPKVHLSAVSPIYETPPWGVLDQPDFLNQVIEAETELYPSELLKFLKQIEKQLGRVASVRYGPRLIDLDILLYDEWILDLPDLTIPHPQMENRAFVLFPLANLAPDLRHPVSGKTIQQLLDAWLIENDPTGIELFIDDK
jgi:2-amino-4-hydroxy-6-hydroxymethyldihydropteridine diphosphokinase